MPDPQPESPTASPAEPPSFNSPVDDPHHFDFQNADVPPDEASPEEGYGAGPVVDKV